MQLKSFEGKGVGGRKGVSTGGIRSFGGCTLAGLGEGNKVEVVVVHFSGRCRGDVGSGRFVWMCL